MLDLLSRASAGGTKILAIIIHVQNRDNDALASRGWLSPHETHSQCRYCSCTGGAYNGVNSRHGGWG